MQNGVVSIGQVGLPPRQITPEDELEDDELLLEEDDDELDDEEELIQELSS